jgi:hypothetical protein
MFRRGAPQLARPHRVMNHARARRFDYCRILRFRPEGRKWRSRPLDELGVQSTILSLPKDGGADPSTRFARSG